MTPEQQLRLWLATDRFRETLYLRTHRIVRNALRDQIRPVVAALEAGRSDAEQMMSAIPIRDAFVKIYPLVGARFARRTYAQLSGMLKKDDTLMTTWEAFMRRYALTEAAEKITGIVETGREVVRKVLAEASEQGWGIAKTARELRKTWGQVSRYRATLISRNELLAASNLGSLTGAQTIATQTGAQLDKLWISTRDVRTRDSHRNINGQRVDLNGTFKVNGYDMKTPGDSSLGAPASETISCRCAISYARKA